MKALACVLLLVSTLAARTVFGADSPGPTVDLGYGLWRATINVESLDTRMYARPMLTEYKSRTLDGITTSPTFDMDKPQ